MKGNFPDKNSGEPFRTVRSHRFPEMFAGFSSCIISMPRTWRRPIGVWRRVRGYLWIWNEKTVKLELYCSFFWTEIQRCNEVKMLLWFRITIDSVNCPKKWVDRKGKIENNISIVFQNKKREVIKKFSANKNYQFSKERICLWYTRIDDMLLKMSSYLEQI